MSATPNINLLKIQGNKFDATAAPTVNDDTSTGFSVGSTWIDVTNDKAYNCVDATTGAAVWNEAGGGGTDTNIANSDLTFGANHYVDLSTYDWEVKKGSDTYFKIPSNGKIRMTSPNASVSDYILTVDNRLGGYGLGILQGDMTAGLNVAGSDNAIIHTYNHSSKDKINFGSSSNTGNYMVNVIDNGIDFGSGSTRMINFISQSTGSEFAGITLGYKAGSLPMGVITGYTRGLEMYLSSSVIHTFNVDGTTILKGTAVVGTEKISLQDNTLIKGSDSAAATSGFKVTDINNASLLDVKNNGVTTFGKYTTPLTGNALSKHFIGNSGRGSNNTLDYNDFVFEDQNGVAVSLFSDASKTNVINCHDGTTRSFIEFKGSNETMNFYNRGNYWLSTYKNSHTVYGKTSSSSTQVIKEGNNIHIFNEGDLQMFVTEESTDGNVNLSPNINLRTAYKTTGGVQGSNNIRIGTNADNVGNYSLVIKDDADSNLFEVKSNGEVSSISTSSVPSFTAKSDGTTDGYIQLNCTANTHGIKLKSPPHSAAASYTLTFPDDAGTNGQVLKTDGSGVLSWITSSTTDTTKLPLAGGAMTGAITTNSTFDGRDVATDGTKLDTVATNADVTNTTSVTNAGALMDSEVTNLAQVKAFDTSDYATSAQGTLATNALPKSGGAMTGAITTNSTFDGRNVSVDGAKLDGISANAKPKPELTKSLYLENPVDADDIPMWEPGVNITITKIVVQTIGGVSTTINFKKRTSGGDVNLWTTDKVITNFVEYTSFDSASCAAGDYIHYICTAKNGVSTGIKLTMTYTED